MKHASIFAATILSFGTLGCDPDPQPPATPAWSEAFPANDLGWLMSVWGPSGDDLYAVGGAPESGVVMHFDGASWARFTLPTGTPLVNWSYGFGASDVTFVGNAGTILHFDGAGLTKSATVTDQALWGVWGAGPSDLWAVGGNGFRDGQATVLRFDGSAWRKVELPALQHPDVFAFYKVWGSGADDVYVVGQRGVVLHWDGRALTELFVGSSEDLVAVWGVAADRVAIVGGRSNGEVVTWDGATWHREPLAPLPGLNGVWMRDRKTVHLAGEDGTIGTYDFDAHTHAVETTSTRLVIHALFGDDRGRLTAVGGSLLSIEPPFRGVALSRALAAGE